MEQTYAKLKKQSGFSLIAGLLLAAVLVGGFTYWMSGSGLNTTVGQTYSNGSKASNIVTQAGYLAGGFNLMVTNGTAANTITFDTAATTGLFNPTSGGTQQQTADPNDFASVTAPDGFWIYKGANLKANNIGITANADYAVILTGLKSGVCQQLNQNMHGSTTIPASAITAAAWRAGGVTATAPTDTTAVDLTAIAAVFNWDRGCMSTSDGNYVYFHVLLAQ